MRKILRILAEAFTLALCFLFILVIASIIALQ